MTSRRDLFRRTPRRVFVGLMLIPVALFVLQALMDLSEGRRLLASRWLVAAAVWLLATLQGPQDATEVAEPTDRPADQAAQRG